MHRGNIRGVLVRKLNLVVARGEREMGKMDKGEREVQASNEKKERKKQLGKSSTENRGSGHLFQNQNHNYEAYPTLN